jgi:purine-nucleoside phosphorylase
MDMAWIEKTAQAARRLLDPPPGLRGAMILGSGWGDVTCAGSLMSCVRCADIPSLAPTSVAGHAGRLLVVRFETHPILVFQGRRHWYEGVGWEPIAWPIFLCRELGIADLLLTNAAGGIERGLQSGDLMAIDDHINAMGDNPLVGEHHSAWGPRFPDQSRVYSGTLSRCLDQAARRAGVSLKHGVYLAAAGPTYETPAEVEAYRRLGADAVGMSTVPEAMLANAAGFRVAGLSCITNRAGGAGGVRLTHDDVLAHMQRALAPMRDVVATFWPLVFTSTSPSPASGLPPPPGRSD